MRRRGGEEVSGSILCFRHVLRRLRMLAIFGRGEYLQLGKREPLSGTDAAVVFERGAADDGAELVDGAGSYGCRLGDPGIAATGWGEQRPSVNGIQRLALCEVLPGRNAREPGAANPFGNLW